MLIADLEKLAGGFDWSAYFNGLNLSKEQVAKLDVEQPEFFKSVAKLMASTPVPTWKAI
jgi:predicted metalloendopeptidase